MYSSLHELYAFAYVHRRCPNFNHAYDDSVNLEVVDTPLAAPFQAFYSTALGRTPQKVPSDV